ncbi:mandelate racemase/muconate lactonizing enzyme family protein [Polluticoccus soli]|uniref:mandelate racemase/muconate lactonizing enzyme family protein n=1 Tax=Polluticoccus soli TaxID=3034150 RepID=UPI0023E29D85|nr:dipeptide epimerase [Flavipsychrobacter sp. JY13-12]
MTIDRIELYHSRIKLKEAFTISLGTFNYADNVLVLIRTSEGLVGHGECSPFMSINGESYDTCLAVGKYLAKGLMGKHPLNIEACSRLMDSIIYGNASIKSAFDMALYDIAAQHAGKPLYKFLKGKKRTLTTDYTVSFGDAKKMAVDAQQIKDWGYEIIKVKLGGTPADDVRRIKAIRQKIGGGIPLVIDANQGWNEKSAIKVLTELSPYNILFCEEPIPRWDFMNLPLVQQHSPIPIMADESCGDHHDALRLIELKACQFFNIKLGKSSGIFKALKIIKLAEATGIKIQLGGFLESRLAFTAASHLATVSDAIQYFDFDTAIMHKEDHVLGGICYTGNGKIELPDGIGLGATIDKAYLRKLDKIVVR